MNLSKLLSLHDKHTAFVTLCASILHLSGFGAIFYLIPLEWYARQRGLHRYKTIVVTSLAIIVVVRLIQGRPLGFTLLEAYMITALACGLNALHSPFRRYITQRRGLMRLSAVGFLFGVTTYPLLYLLLENTAWLSTLQQTVVELLNTQFAVSISTVEVTDIVQQVTNIILSSYLFIYILSVIGIWIIGELLSKSAVFKKRGAPTLVRKKFDIAAFALPSVSIWVLIEIMSFFLLTSIWLPWVHPLFVNLLLVALVYYLLQGMAIVYAMATNRIKLPNASRLALSLLAVSIIVPGVNLLSIAILLLLGISETWVMYKSRNRLLN